MNTANPHATPNKSEDQELIDADRQKQIVETLRRARERARQQGDPMTTKGPHAEQLQVSHMVPKLCIDLRLSYICESNDVQVPLGSYNKTGKWVPRESFRVVEIEDHMTLDELLGWLSSDEGFMLERTDYLEAALAQAAERCRHLSNANSAHFQQTLGDH